MIRITDSHVKSKLLVNYQIIHWLQILVKYLRIQLPNQEQQQQQRTRFKLLHLTGAIRILSECPKVYSGEDAMEYKGIGKGIGRRIDEILTQGKLSEIADYKPKRSPGLSEWKIDRSTAEYIFEIIEDKIKDLKNPGGCSRVDKADFDFPVAIVPGNLENPGGCSRVDKADFDFPVAIVPGNRENPGGCSRVGKADFEMYRCGQYRLGKRVISELTLLILTDSPLPEITGIFQKFLIPPSRARYYGIGYIDGISFRLDIRILPINSRGTGMLYLTGSDIYIELLCTDADRQGYILNEYGLYPKPSQTSDGDSSLDTIIFFEKEEDVLTFLGFEYLIPRYRNL